MKSRRPTWNLEALKMKFNLVHSSGFAKTTGRSARVSSPFCLLGDSFLSRRFSRHTRDSINSPQFSLVRGVSANISSVPSRLCRLRFHFHTTTSPHLRLGRGHRHIILHVAVEVTGEGAGSREREAGRKPKHRHLLQLVFRVEFQLHFAI